MALLLASHLALSAPFLVICWTTFGYFRGISGFGVADGHDPRCLLCSPLLTCLLWLWRPPNVAPGFASQFLPGHQQAGRSRENWRRNPSRPISGEILRAIQKDSESPIGLKKGQKVTEILPRRPLPAQVYSVHLRCKAVVRLLFGSQGVWFHKVNYQS